MKRLALLWLLLTGIALGARAQSPDAEFLRIYNLIQEGESLEASGEAAPALDRFRTARQDLRAFAKVHPAWNPKIIRFRMEFLAQRLEVLNAKVPATAAPGGAGATVEAVAARGTEPRPGLEPVGTTVADSLSLDLADARARADQADAKASAAEARADAALRKADETAVRLNEAGDRMAQLALDLRQARDRVEVLEASHANLDKSRARLEREKTTLEARLKEALSPKAAAVDPAELAKAEERILLLVKENEILKAGLDHQMGENKRILETARRAVELEQQLQGARTELTALRRQADELRGDRQKLAARLDTLTRKSDEQATSLKSEIESLKKDLAAARSPGRTSGSGDAVTELASLRVELAEQRSAGEKLRRENDTLLREIEKLTDIRVTPASLKVSEVPLEEASSGQMARYRRLERERDELRAELESTRAELSRAERAVSDSGSEERSRQLTREVARLEAKVGVLQSKPDPYSAEELALFQKPAPAPRTMPVQVAQAAPAPASASAPPAGAASSPAATPAAASTNAAPGAAAGTAGGGVSTNKPAVSRRRTIRDLPPGASVLAAQAQRAFGQRRLDEAERAYREILKIDENNVFTLGNLAAIVVEQGRVEEGETLLKKALALDAQDPFSLSLLGILRFRQQRYEDAFEALSQAAQLDPEDPATQTYLGITLSERGQRPAAEAALRKALKLAPGSAAAHYNLSVVYATQKPPFLELARYHYEKARRAGQPANPAFEAVLKGETRPAGAAPAK